MERGSINSYFKAIWILCLMLSLFRYSKASAQITFKDEPIQLKKQTFYVAQVSDERKVKAPIAQLATKTGGNNIHVVPANLEADPAQALGRYLSRNLSIDKSRWPVIIQVRDLKIIESAAVDGRIQGEISLVLSFGLEEAYGFEHLLDYPGRLHYVRSIDNSGSIERNLRSMINGGLIYLNDWITENAQTSVKLAKNVQIRFSDYSQKVEGDTIYYSPNRPLTWADFQSTLRPSGPYQAAVMPSIGYTEEAKVEHGIVEVNIAVKAYVPKSACWASPTGRDDYALLHEQGHFDIVKIIAEQFKRKMLAKKLTPDDYEAAINMQYLDSFRDMNTMQKAYDSETAHGQNRLAQDQWNVRIAQALNQPSR